jgi:hypothetical protein
MIEKRIFLTATQGDWRRFAGSGFHGMNFLTTDGHGYKRIKNLKFEISDFKRGEVGNIANC